MKIVDMLKKNVLVLICVACCGCATWTKVGGEFSNSSAMYKVGLPAGWMKYRSNDILITKNGIFLDNIRIDRMKVDQKLSYTKKKFIKGMLPHDIAGIYIDNIVSNPTLNNFELIENVPANLGGQDAFRLTCLFRNQDGLKYKSIVYGFGYENWIYFLDYTSTVDYYFDKSIADFESVVASFKFLPVKPR